MERKTGVMTINGEVLLLYFLNLKNYAISSTWSKYSMAKAAIKVYKNIDIGKYSKLTAYLKRFKIVFFIIPLVEKSNFIILLVDKVVV
jgi:hypothetical protein